MADKEVKQMASSAQEIEQVTAYENQIKDTKDLVSRCKESVKSALIGQEYKDNAPFLVKLNSVADWQFRRIRRDGNCFYRCVAFAYLESMLSQKTLKQQAVEDAQKPNGKHWLWLAGAGYEEFAIVDFWEEYYRLLTDSGKDIDSLLTDMNDIMISNAVVVHMRFLASAYLKCNEELYLPFLLSQSDSSRYLSNLPGDAVLDMDTFCRMYVESMDSEADQVQIVALVNALNIVLNIAYLDAQGGALTDQRGIFHRFTPTEWNGTDDIIELHLLFRPGHYDILYQQT
ncbi:hypothetical protein MP228_005183 [Amoeboaphelidium protococcarum]|nr:hypothetical protein MP228_005183 [Amoeboaphelidium protococcarum]